MFAITIFRKLPPLLVMDKLLMLCPILLIVGLVEKEILFLATVTGLEKALVKLCLVNTLRLNLPPLCGFFSPPKLVMLECIDAVSEVSSS